MLDLVRVALCDPAAEFSVRLVPSRVVSCLPWESEPRWKRLGPIRGMSIANEFAGCEQFALSYPGFPDGCSLPLCVSLSRNDPSSLVRGRSEPSESI